MAVWPSWSWDASRARTTFYAGAIAAAHSRTTLEQMFEQWASNPNFPTLKRVYRRVYVDMRKALPGCVGGFVRNRNLTIRSEGLYLNEWEMGHQIAWIRTHDLHWIGVVKVEATSSNEMSRVTMTLWLPPGMFQVACPEGFRPRYKR